MDVDWNHTTDIVRKRLKYLNISPNDLDDVVQECLLRIHKDMYKFDGIKCNWITFIYKQIQWAFLDFVRKRCKGIGRKDRTIFNPFKTNCEWSDRHTDDDDDDEHSITCYPYVEDDIEDQRIELVLRRLQRRYGYIVALWARGLSQENISKLMCISPGRVSQIVKKSIEYLQKIDREVLLEELV